MSPSTTSSLRFFRLGSGSAGQIQTYDADSETGALRSGQPVIPSGGVNPVAMTTTADYSNLYVVNQGSNNIVHFAIAGNGILSQKDVVTTSATPVWVAVNTAQTYLYVVSGPNPPFSRSTPCRAALSAPSRLRSR